MIKEHRCQFLPESGLYLLYEKDDPAWILHIQKEATESDLEENNNLENIGDIIWLTQIEVRHCPFCGECLTGLESVDSEHYGEFRHHDFARLK